MIRALAAVAAASTMMLMPAPATAQAAKDVRYAWVGSCPKKDYTVPCGSWTLALRGGGSLALKDAVVHPTTSAGTTDKEASAPIAISGDGRLVSYFRKNDGKLVVRDVAKGTVKALPGKTATLPRGLGMGDLDTAFSNDGSRFFIDYFDPDAKLKSVIVNLRTGTVTRIPGAEIVQGFSPNGEYVLTARTTNDNTTEFAVYDGSGDEVQSRVVPQIVSNNAPIALSDDGTTVGIVITGPQVTSKARLRTYDLSTDAVSEAVTLSYPPSKEFPSRLVWDSSDGLTLWTYRATPDGSPNAAVKRHINPDTGTATKLDSFAIKSGIWTWWLPGD
ncbi:hypothetical protein ACIBG8_27065 [Nonomuraea sp. NPDC050556]|uniref:hypothetical protein n=1 Tax=Nonomuraea sp. NPDC050556 TaxID=3364369 RepID=UPI00379A3CED